MNLFRKQGDETYGGTHMSWIYWSLLSAVFAGATAVLAKVGVTGIDSNLATAVRTSVILIFSWSIAYATIQPDALRNLSPRTWVFLVFSGLATGASWLCYFRALQLGEASRVAPVDKLSVAFVILFASLFLGERLTLFRVAGGVLIVAGAVILALE
jgi:transporter family protein